MAMDSTAYLARLYGLSNNYDETRSIYDDWAKTYDNDMAGPQDYQGPVQACAYLLKALGTPQINANVEILDAGCGTGLVGATLAKAGAKKIDGLDLSQGMLEVARGTGVYRTLKTADLSKAISEPADRYDAVVCIGTLTQGHVGPVALGEFARVVKPGGFIVATVLETIWKTGGYEAEVARLAEAGRVKLVDAALEDYRRGENVKAMMIVLQVQQ